MNKFVATAAVSLAAVVCSAATIPPPPDAKYLFTLVASSGTFAADVLSLEGIPTVVYFADRPTRASGHTDLLTFLGMWDKGVDNFKDDPPNAELSIYTEDGDKHAVLIISKPSVDEDSISFTVSLLDKKNAIPASFKHSTLFIDSTSVTDVTVINHSNDSGTLTTYSKPSAP